MNYWYFINNLIEFVHICLCFFHNWSLHRVCCSCRTDMLSHVVSALIFLFWGKLVRSHNSPRVFLYLVKWPYTWPYGWIMDSILYVLIITRQFMTILSSRQLCCLQQVLKSCKSARLCPGSYFLRVWTWHNNIYFSHSERLAIFG